MVSPGNPEKGWRSDGRTASELRPISITPGVLNRADGSCYLEWGRNKVFAAVYGPKEIQPRYHQNPTRAVLNAAYSMAAFSVKERKRPGPDRRSIEISKLTGEALSRAVFLELFPRATIDVHIEVIEADAGTRCAGITAASVALADAGIPMRDLVAACASGKVDGTMVLDLSKDEDNYGEADVPVALIPSTDEIVLLQMDGNLSRAELMEAVEMSRKAIKEIIKPLQANALKEKYSQMFAEEDFDEDGTGGIEESE